jgi:uncharacterized membrane protein
MTVESTTNGFGWRGSAGARVYGLGVMAIGFTTLAFGTFDPSQPVPENFPARVVLAYIAGVFMVAAAAAVEWRRTAAWGAAALTVYWTLFVIVLMNGRLLLASYATYGPYEEIAIELAIPAGGLIVYATTARIDAMLAARLARVGRLAFGACALVFGGAHFVYMNLTAPLVPKWLPPTQEFWGYLTGVAFEAAGIAFLTGVQARLAAILLTAMLAIFGVLANGRMLLADHASHFNWTESATNLAEVGAAWVLADSLGRQRQKGNLQ